MRPFSPLYATKVYFYIFSQVLSSPKVTLGRRPGHDAPASRGRRPFCRVEKNIYLTFFSEVYDKIQQNYWEKISDEHLVNIFSLGIEKLTKQPQSLKKADKEGLKKLLDQVLQ